MPPKKATTNTDAEQPEAASGTAEGKDTDHVTANAQTEKQPAAQAEEQTEAQPEALPKSPNANALSKKRKATEESAKEAEVDKVDVSDAQLESQEESREELGDDVNGQSKHEAGSKSSKRRKVNKTSDQSREGARKSGRGVQKPQPSQKQLLKFLLSEAAADICRPEDETKDLQERGSDIKTYTSSVLSPFEELLCAVVLSRPISHRLGMRTIRTILNEPYQFTTPKRITEAGKEKVHQALDDARTQHKDKTAESIALIAEVVTSQFAKEATDTSLEKLRETGHYDWDSERDLLQHSIKGMGKTGLDIFCRRTQWLFDELYPFIDERSARGLDKLGLPKNADKVVQLLQEHWDELDSASLSGDDTSTKQRRAFVLICERATGADLEGKIEAMIQAAASI